MLMVNSRGRVVNVTKRPSPQNAINRYCRAIDAQGRVADNKTADINKTSPHYMFTFNDNSHNSSQSSEHSPQE